MYQLKLASTLQVVCPHRDVIVEFFLPENKLIVPRLQPRHILDFRFHDVGSVCAFDRHRDGWSIHWLNVDWKLLQ